MRRRITSGALGLAALALFASPPAEAGTSGPRIDLGTSKGLTYFKSVFPNVVSPAGADVACDGPAAATGGGATIAGDPSSANLTASASQPDVSGWRGRARSSDDGRKQTTYAICGNEEVDYTSTGSFDRMAPFEIIEGLTCDAEDKVGLSGGVVLSDGDARISGIYRDPPIFDASLAYRVFTGSTDTDVSVTCSADYDVKFRNAEVEDSGAGAMTATAKCKKNEAVAGGGFRLQRKNGDNQFDAWVVGTRPVDTKADGNKVPDDGWRSKLFNNANGKHVLTATATCIS